MHKCVPYFSQSSNESKRQSSKFNFCFVGISIVWPCSLFLCQCSSDKWIKTPKSLKLNFCFILSFCFIWFWLHDLVLYFSLSLPQVNESNAQKLEPWFLFYLGRDCKNVFPAQFVLHPNRPSILHQQRDRHLLSSISHEFEIAFNFLTTSPIWHSPFSRHWHCC